MLVEQLMKQRTQQMIPARRKFSHKVKITTEYDRFSNETTIGTDYIKRVYKGRDHYIAMRAYFSYAGAGVSDAPPSFVHLAFASESSRWKYLDPPALLVLADSQRLNLDVVERVDSETRYIRDVGVATFEYLDIAVPTSRFLQIINASSVEMQLGQAEIPLKDEHLEVLRDLASRIQQ